jgi:hypothetical protein
MKDVPPLNSPSLRDGIAGDQRRSPSELPLDLVHSAGFFGNGPAVAGACRPCTSVTWLAKHLNSTNRTTLHSRNDDKRTPHTPHNAQTAHHTPRTNRTPHTAQTERAHTELTTRHAQTLESGSCGEWCVRLGRWDAGDRGAGEEPRNAQFSILNA